MKSLITPLVLAVLLGSILILPKKGGIAESAVKMDIEDRMGEWHLRVIPPSDKEIGILAKDTAFSKANCFLPRVEERSFITGETPYDQAQLSIVLSGHDLNNSIHRPERCMPAQGHRIHAVTNDSLDLGGGRTLPLRRLLSRQELVLSPESKESVSLDCLTYYFFIGHSDITASHEERTLIDMRDRLLKGQDQRWAYVQVSMCYDPEADGTPGQLPDYGTAEKKIRELLSELADRNIDWAMIASN